LSCLTGISTASLKTLRPFYTYFVLTGVTTTPVFLFAMMAYDTCHHDKQEACMDKQFSENFWLSEFLVSQEAARRGLTNLPGPSDIDNLNRLCDLILQPLRNFVKKPISVSSGYRAPAVNRAVGGSSTSAHMYGLAADINVPGMSPAVLMHTIRGLQLPVDQVIEEYGQWVHVGLASPGRKPRGEYLLCRLVAGKPTYTPVKFK
jgi:zinc D-Ala-D-Ala carboxypeptidase